MEVIHDTVARDMRRLFKSFVLGVMALASVGANAQHSEMWLNRLNGVAASFTVPSWMEISSASVSTAGANTQVQFTMGASVPGTISDVVCFEAQFGNRLIALPLGGYTLGSSPNLGPGQVGVMDIPSGTIVAYGSYSVNGSELTIQAPTSSLGGYSARIAATCYLPGGTELSLNVGNFGGQLGDYYDLDPALANVHTLLPMHPEGSGGSLRFNELPQLPVHFPWIIPGGITFPPQPGQGTWAASIGPTHEGGYDFGVSAPWPGRPGYYVNLYSIGGAFRIGYGYDTNGNGRLDPSEVTQWVAKCGYDGGRNGYFGWFQGADGKWYFTWRNYSHNLHQSMTYVYDPWNNILKVYNQNAILVYQGPPNGYWGWPGW